MTQEPHTHPTDEELADHIRGAPSESERARVALHLESCQECKRAVDELRLVVMGLDAERLAHIPEHVLVQFQTGGLPAIGETASDTWSLERIQSHISYCDRCKAELELLNYLDTGSRQNASDAHPNAIQNLSLSHPTPRRQWRAVALIPMAIAAILTIMIATQSPIDVRLSAPAWKTVAQAVPMEDLISLNLRSSSATDTTIGYPTAEQAALAEFRKLLQLTDDGIRPFDSPQPTVPANAGRILRAVLQTSTGDHADTLVRAMPDGIPGDGHVAAWLLRMPARELRSSVMRGDVLEVAVELQSREFAGFVWTFESGGQHFGLPAHIMSPSD